MLTLAPLQSERKISCTCTACYLVLCFNFRDYNTPLSSVRNDVGSEQAVLRINCLISRNFVKFCTKLFLPWGRCPQGGGCWGAIVNMTGVFFMLPFQGDKTVVSFFTQGVAFGLNWHRLLALIRHKANALWNMFLVFSQSRKEVENDYRQGFGSGDYFFVSVIFEH